MTSLFTPALRSAFIKLLGNPSVADATARALEPIIPFLVEADGAQEELSEALRTLSTHKSRQVHNSSSPTSSYPSLQIVAASIPLIQVLVKNHTHPSLLPMVLALLSLYKQYPRASVLHEAATATLQVALDTDLRAQLFAPIIALLKEALTIPPTQWRPHLVLLGDFLCRPEAKLTEEVLPEWKVVLPMLEKYRVDNITFRKMGLQVSQAAPGTAPRTP